MISFLVALGNFIITQSPEGTAVSSRVLGSFAGSISLTWCYALNTMRIGNTSYGNDLFEGSLASENIRTDAVNGESVSMDNLINSAYWVENIMSGDSYDFSSIDSEDPMYRGRPLLRNAGPR